jgi:hypothetical protein
MENMKLVNRGFLAVTPKQAFWNWANKIEGEFEMEFNEQDEIEPTMYLITEDFMDVEPVIEQNFKKIFKAELMAITDEESKWPEERPIELFQEWFKVSAGSMVFDLDKSDLKVEKV